MRVCSLGSGSRGNCTVVADASTTILLDCGFSARETALRLTLAGFSADCVDALLVTHEHSDHIAGVGVFSRRFDVPVHATQGVAKAGRLDAKVGRSERAAVVGLERVRVWEPFRVGSIEVTAFPTSHDSREPVAYVFSARGRKAAIVTDLGVCGGEVLEAACDCDLLGLESNHDLGMLANGPYPAFLKRRISSEVGHLSNADAACALEKLACGRLRHLLALHLSETNNTPAHALDALEGRLAGLSIDVPVIAASQWEPSAVLEV